MMPKIYILFEHNHDVFPAHTEGPFFWVEAISGNLFGCRDEDEQAEEIAGVNDDGTWDAGPFEEDESGVRKRRSYSRWTLFTNETPKHDDGELEGYARRAAVMGSDFLDHDQQMNG